MSPGREHVLAPSGEAEREDRRMLDQPELVVGVGRARRVEGLHRAPRGLVRDEPEAPRDHHSTIITIGCFESSE